MGQTASGTLVAALDYLGSMVVLGVHNYAPEQTPGALSGAQLPALVIAPELGGRAPGLEPNRFTANAGRLEIDVAHLLLVAPVAGGGGLRTTLRDVAVAIDSYLLTLTAAPTLGGNLPLPLRCAVRLGVVRYADIDYHGAVFIHHWVLDVAP